MISEITTIVRSIHAQATCGNRAQLYHVHDKPLYHAIGEPDSRYRRAVPARSAADRLMRLDAALTSPHLEWLTTRPEKLTYLHAMAAHDPSDQALNARRQDNADPANQFPGTFPIGIDQGGRVVLLYLVTVPWTDDFRTFLVGHVALLSVAPAWTLRIVFPQPLRRAVTAYQTVVQEELDSPLQADAIVDLKRYFFHRRRGTDLNAIPEPLRAFLQRCAQVFGGPRFIHLYTRWLTEEDAALTPVSSEIHNALASRRGEIECVVLPHTYRHLSPLVSRRPARRRGLQQWDERGDETPHGINPVLNPVS